MSELHALLSRDEFVVFDYNSLTRFLNPNFWCKNENPEFKREPIITQRLLAKRKNPSSTSSHFCLTEVS